MSDEFGVLLSMTKYERRGLTAGIILAVFVTAVTTATSSNPLSTAIICIVSSVIAIAIAVLLIMAVRKRSR